MDAARRSPLGGLGADRLLILTSLGLLTLIAWAYLWLVAAGMERGDMSLMDGASMPMDGMAGMSPAPWDAATFALTFLMWWVMMIGMMVPSAWPVILLHARVHRHYSTPSGALGLTPPFTLGYLIAWAAFSLAATAAQWALHASELLLAMTMSVGTTLGAVLFAAAGLYQLSPLKNVCLRHCRSPVEFLTMHRRPGSAGAFITGAHHGLYCVGCCWMLMTLLFAGGVMNLLWVAALAVLVLLEKLVPSGHWVARGSGVAMLAVAAFLAFAV